MCCHTAIEVADQTFYLPQSQYTDTGPTSPSADPVMPGAWQDSHWSTNFEVTGMTRPRKILSQVGFKPRILHSQGRREVVVGRGEPRVKLLRFEGRRQTYFSAPRSTMSREMLKFWKISELLPPLVQQK